jgi:hypothetical protein
MITTMSAAPNGFSASRCMAPDWSPSWAGRPNAMRAIT